jgi:hypothetical protein
MPRTGRCLCGEVRYELDGDLGPLVNCHCRYCRRAHGAAFATIAWVRATGLRFTSGEEAVREYGTQGGLRLFCGRCGTRLLNRPRADSPFVALVAGSLDEDPVRAPVMHINVESKAAWYEILDGRPQHAALPPEAARALQE